MREQLRRKLKVDYDGIPLGTVLEDIAKQAQIVEFLRQIRGTGKDQGTSLR